MRTGGVERRSQTWMAMWEGKTGYIFGPGALPIELGSGVLINSKKQALSRNRGWRGSQRDACQRARLSQFRRKIRP